MQKNYNHRNLPASDGWRFNVSLHRHLGRLCALLLTLLAVNATAWADSYNSATTTFNVTVTDSSTPTGGSTKWDFSTMTDTEVQALKDNTTYFTKRDKNDYVQSSNSTYWPKNTDIPIQDANGVDIHVFEGLKIYRAGSNIGNQVRIYYNSGLKRLYLGGSGYTIKMPSQNAGNIVKVTWNTINDTESIISGSNMTATTNLSSSNKAQTVTTEFRVDNNGEVAFSFTNNSQVYKIEVIELEDLTTFAPNGDQNRTLEVGTTINDLQIVADPMSAMNASLLSIESSDPAVVDVSSATASGIGSGGYFTYGGIQAVGAGTATLTIHYAGNDTYRPASCTVTITVTDDRTPVTRFSPMGNQRAKLNINYSDFNGNSTKDITNFEIVVQPVGVFSASDFQVISSSNQEVVPLSSISLGSSLGTSSDGTSNRLHVNYTVNKVEGESTITVRFKGTEDYSPANAIFTVTVTDDRTKISLSSPDHTLLINKSYTPVITIIDGNGNEVTGLAITMTSSANRVTVSGNTLTATTNTGGATITLNYAGSEQYKPATATFKVTVADKMPVTIESGTITMLRETTENVLDHISLVDANGVPLSIDQSLFSLNWKNEEDHGSIVSINGLSVTSGTTTGKATLKITYAGNDTYALKTEELVVEVVKVSAPDIAVSGDNVTITQVQGATVYYTTDGSDPRTSNTRQTDTLPIRLTTTKTSTIYAVAIDNEDYSRVSEKNIVKTGTYQYTLEGSENAPASGLVVTNKDGDNVVMRMTYGDLPEFEHKYSNIWRTKARDGRMRDAEFDNYQISTIAENYDGTSEDGYKLNNGNGIGLQFVGYANNTPFSLPIAGAYLKFEPEVDGLLQVVIRQNGAFIETDDIDTEASEKYNLRRRVVFFADETGRAYQPGTEYTAQMNLNSTIDPKLYDFNHTNVKKEDRANFNYYQELLFGTTMTDDVWAAKRDKEALANKLTTCLVQQTGDAANSLGEVPGYLCVTKAYVKYTINVKAGKTYFLTGNLTKVGLCGYQFTPDANYDKGQQKVLNEGTAGGDAVNGGFIREVNKNHPHDVQLNRAFESGQWYTLVLPFSVSASKVKELFGDQTLILNFADVTAGKNEDGKDIIVLNLRKHYHQMIVAGMPLLIKPSKAFASGTVIPNVTLEALTVNPMNQIVHGNNAISKDAYYINGSYEPTAMPSYAYYLVGDEFKQKTNGNTTNTKAMRAWITGTGPNLAKVNYVNLFTDFADEDMGIATEVEQIAEALGLQPVVTGAIYNLNGQKVSADGNRDGLPAGVYVQNGKKFVVR